MRCPGVLPREEWQERFGFNAGNVRQPGGTTDHERAFAEVETFKDLCSVEAHPAGARLRALEGDWIHTRSDRGLHQPSLAESAGAVHTLPDSIECTILSVICFPTGG